jgi:hypothetical protein
VTFAFVSLFAILPRPLPSTRGIETMRGGRRWGGAGGRRGADRDAIGCGATGLQ